MELSLLSRTKQRWLLVVGSIWLLTAAGGVFNFGIYSEAMKESLVFSQKSINTIALSRDIGQNVAFHLGVAYLYFGPHVMLFAAASLNFAAHIIIWAISTRRLNFSSTGLISVLFLLVSNAQISAYTVALISLTNKFSRNRGTVVAMLGGMYSVSSAVITLFFQAINGSRSSLNYLLFNACFASAVYLFVIPIFSKSTMPEQGCRGDRKMLHKFLVVISAVAAYLFVVIIVKISVHRVSQAIDIELSVLLVFMLVAFPLGVVATSTSEPLEIDEEPQSTTGKTDEEQQQEQEHQPEPQQQQGQQELQHMKRGDNCSVKEAFLSLDMAMLVVISVVSLGSIFVVVDNLGQIGQAWGYTTKQVANFTLLMNIWNFIGRLGSGLASEFFLGRGGVPRPFFLALSVAIAVICHLIVALKLAGSRSFFLVSGFCGLSIGAQVNLSLTIMLDLFGQRNYPFTFSVPGASSVLGTYIFSVPLVGTMYDIQARHSTDKLVCYGVRCYHWSFLIMAGACMVACLLSFILSLRTISFYKEFKEK